MCINRYGNYLIALCKACDMRIVNGRVHDDKEGRLTRVATTGKSVVDYILVDSEMAKLVSFFKVGHSYPESDHRPLLLHLDMKLKHTNCPSLEGLPMYNYMWRKEQLLDLEKTFIDATFNDLKMKFHLDIQHGEDVNLVSESWYEYFTSCIESVFDKKVIRCKKRKKAPWFDSECSKKRQELLCNFDGSQSDLVNEYKAFLQRKKSYKQCVLYDLEQKLCNDPNGCWSFNSLQNQTSTVQLHPSEVCDKLEVLSIIPHQDYFDKQFEDEVTCFVNTYSECKENSEYDKCVYDPLMSEILNRDIEVQEVVQAVSKIKSGRAPGIDRFPIEYVKCTIDVIKEDLTCLFNHILQQGEYPDKWGEGLRVVIPKGANDIRPITIEPLFAKIFETVLDNRIIFINDAFKKTDVFNGGFKKGCQTQDNLLILTTCIEKQLALGQNLFVAFVDFTKAFNYINHAILLYKLLKTGITGRFFKTIKSMYSKIKGIVKVNDRLYNTILDSCGSNQGGPLSPNICSATCYLICVST